MPSTGAARVREKKPEQPQAGRGVPPVAIAIAVVAAIVAGIGTKLFLAKPAARIEQPLAGYISDSGTVLQEYAKFKGKAPKTGSIATQFQQAAALAQKADYQGALAVLEPLSKEAAVPAVFNDLGVLYTATNDRSRAVNAFREALARDISYAAVRENLERLRALPNSADPVSTEVEPNYPREYANLIGLNKPVDGEIAAANNDVDMFRFVAPAAPRDRLEITVTNRSQTLEPRVRFYDSEGGILPWSKTEREPGASLSLILSLEPNTPVYLELSGDRGTGGAYTLTVKPLKGFDELEPNDDIYSASKLEFGKKIDANLMDADDTDYYTFTADHSGKVTINLENRSATLMPAVTTFGSDMRTSGFGPDVRNPGDGLHHTFDVLEGQKYYIQVWPQAKSSGEYSLTITSHPN